MSSTPRSSDPSADGRLTRWMLLTVDAAATCSAVVGGLALALGLKDDNLGLGLPVPAPLKTYA